MRVKGEGYGVFAETLTGRGTLRGSQQGRYVLTGTHHSAVVTGALNALRWWAANTHTQAHKHTGAHTHTNRGIHTHSHRHTHTGIHTNINTGSLAHTHTQTHTGIHTHAHT